MRPLRLLLLGSLLLATPLAGAQTAVPRPIRPRPTAPHPTHTAATASAAPSSAPPASAAPATIEVSSAPPATPPSPAPENVASAPPPPASAAPSGAPAANPALPVVALIDAFPSGVDPAAATFVTDVLRQTITNLGHAIVPTPQLYDAARRVQLPFPPPPDGMGALLQALQVPIAVTCEVRGGGGYYQALLRVRFAQEPVERIRQVVATQWTLGDSLRQTLPALLSPPAPMVQPYPYGQLPAGELNPYTPIPRRPPARLHAAKFELTLGAEFALGPGTDSFFNFLAYGRAAWFPVDRFGITASVAYGNLRGRTNRVSNALFMVGIETAIELIPSLHVYLPLRVEGGYLPFNGPVLRATAGVAFNVARSVRLELDLLSPTVWILPGVAAVSMDLGAQLIFELGAPPRRHRRHRHTTEETETSSAPPEGTSSASPTPDLPPPTPAPVPTTVTNPEDE